MSIIKEILKESKRMNVNPNETTKILKELFIFDQSNMLKQLGSQEELLDEKDELPLEFWEEIIELINESYNENPKLWIKKLKEVKEKILLFKYFTKQDMIDLDSLEKNLRIDIKKYFSALQTYKTLDDFCEKFFNISRDVLFNFTRFILNKSEELNRHTSFSKDELFDKIEDLKKERKKIIDKISFISNKNPTFLELTKIKELFEIGLFYENNYLNKGVCEFIYKLLSSNNIEDKLNEYYTSYFVKDFLKLIESTNSYISHNSELRDGTGSEFFTDKGLQIGRRFDIQIESIKNNDMNSFIIDTKSIFKEPYAMINTSFKQNETSIDTKTGNEDLNTDSTTGGFSGSGFSGGSEISAEPLTGGEVTPDSGDELPKTKDGLPVDFGTTETSDVTNPEKETLKEPKEEI